MIVEDWPVSQSESSPSLHNRTCKLEHVHSSLKQRRRFHPNVTDNKRIDLIKIPFKIEKTSLFESCRIMMIYASYQLVHVKSLKEIIQSKC